MPSPQMRYHATVAVAALIGVPAIAARPMESWGRAGVSFGQYRADAVACGRVGANADISRQPSTRAFVAAENWNDRNLNAPQAGLDAVREQALMVGRLNPAKRLEEVQRVHVSATEGCLMQLGYRRFTLTDDQARSLARLKAGSPARHAFLHALAADATVMSRQASSVAIDGR